MIPTPTAPPRLASGATVMTVIDVPWQDEYLAALHDTQRGLG